jgi:hypothetical protein
VCLVEVDVIADQLRASASAALFRGKRALIDIGYLAREIGDIHARYFAVFNF